MPAHAAARARVLPVAPASRRAAARRRRRGLTHRHSFGHPHLPANRLLLCDNLSLLGTLGDGSVDLAYVDPPFATQTTRRTRASEHVFDDRFDGVDGYLDWLRPRLSELHRVLAPTGSLFVHLDWRAAHHARSELDRLFGARQFRNEIVWHYGLGGRAPSNAFARKHDTILFYARSPGSHFHPLRGAATPAMERKYSHTDERGRYMLSYGKRYYLRGGKLLDSVWDIPAIAPGARERVGYPTQKPEALLERVMASASAPGQVVLDICCGSGTTAVVAQRLGRSFITCDTSQAAISLAEQRLVVAARLCAETAPVADLVVDTGGGLDSSG